MSAASSSGLFVNQANSALVRAQISARPSGYVPSALLNQNFAKIPPSEICEVLEKEIKPIEKTAVLYSQNITAPKMSEIFLRSLNLEKGSSRTFENLKRILEIKDKLLLLIQKFSGIDPQLNCLKILTFRLGANFSNLLKDTDFCNRTFTHTSSSLPSSVRQSVSKTRADLLKKEIILFFDKIRWIEKWILDESQDVPSQEIELSKERIKSLLLATSDPSINNKKINETLQNIKDDLELISGLLLAPQTLIPLAISALGTTPLTELSQASQELGKILETYFHFISDIIENHCTLGLKTIEQKGCNAKKCQEAIKVFFRFFKKNYTPLWSEIQQSYLSICRQIFIKSYVSPDDHFRNCKKILSQLIKLENQLELLHKVYSDLLNILQEAPSLPNYKVLTKVLINEYLLPFHNVFYRFYSYSIQCLDRDLNCFFQAHQQYNQWIPSQQRQMQAGIYTPIDLIYFNLLESIESISQQTAQFSEQSSITAPLTASMLKAYYVVVQSRQCYQLNFPCFAGEKKSILELFDESDEAVNQSKQAAQQEATSSSAIPSLIEKFESLLNCLQQFVSSSSAYPFLFNFLGSQAIQPPSYEHQFSALLINFIYGIFNEWRASQFITTFKLDIEKPLPQFLIQNGFELSDVSLLKKGPVARGELTLIDLNIAHENYFQKGLSLGWKRLFMLPIFTIWWENIPTATSANLTEICPKFARLMSRLETKKKDLSMIRFIEGNDSTLIDHFLEGLDTLMLLPYKNLSRYVAQLSIEHNESLLKKQKVRSTTQQHLRKPVLSTPESTSANPLLTPIDTLHFSAEQIGQFLALLIHTLDTASFLDMRDFHSQVVYHLGSIEDLLAKDMGRLSIIQLQTLLTHQACAIEQSVKLATLARLSQEKPQVKPPEELTQLLRSSHRPSEFFSFLPMGPNTDETEWEKVIKTASAVDGFLTGPARYAVTTHPWMDLLDLLKQEEPIIEEIAQLIYDNLSAIQTLLANITQSLQTPNMPFVASSSPVGYLEGLKEKNLLVSPPQSPYMSYSADSLSTSVDQLLKIHSVSRLSQYETTAHLVQRREAIHANLYMIRVNIEQIEILLQDSDPVSWCSSYSSTLLLRASAILEKSVQNLLFWLPVPSQLDTQLHHLLSTRPLSNGRSVPLRHTHSIKENALLCFIHLATSGETTLASSLESFAHQFGWLDPFIQQLYRYPFSPIEDRSADILRLFNTLAYLRRSLGDSGAKEMLQKELATPSQNLSLAYDQLIQAHLNSQVIAPVHEILQASQQILAMLVEISNCTI